MVDSVDDEISFKYDEEEAIEDIIHPNVTIYINESSSNMTSRGNIIVFLYNYNHLNIF
jgi:hypothetical protein